MVFKCRFKLQNVIFVAFFVDFLHNSYFFLPHSNMWRQNVTFSLMQIHQIIFVRICHMGNTFKILSLKKIGKTGWLMAPSFRQNTNYSTIENRKLNGCRLLQCCIHFIRMKSATSHIISLVWSELRFEKWHTNSQWQRKSFMHSYARVSAWMTQCVCTNVWVKYTIL